MDIDELHALVTKAARGGSVAAMRLAGELLEKMRPKNEGPDALGLLIAKRKARRGELGVE